MHVYLFPALERSADVFAHLGRRVPVALMDAPTHPDRFTPREVFAHLADWEPILREERLRAPLANPGMTIAAYDEGDLAIAHRYAESEPAERIEAFRRERLETIALLKSLTPEQWKIEMVHPERGRMTVDDLANMLVGHDMYHVHQLMDVLD